MTIDVTIKSDTQIWIEITPEELTACPEMQKVINTLTGTLMGYTVNNVVAMPALDPTPAPAPAKKPAPAKESTPKNPRALEIDKGKICALWKSGSWSVKDIAADVHCSEQTVRNTLQARGLWKTDEADADLLD